ncbi:MAG: glycoside hydrolase family 13 domain protein [Frankiales bacterium]|nr:glycoside hydrolase family 13 domain protein [Frankiales bacterium]MCW2587423.1 glycoside hydrolase family 13 domain protein [Frankiales bacterium]
MIVKRKRLGTVQVTFVQQPRDEPVFVVGSFNDWRREPLKRAKDGTLRATVSAAPGDTLAFRYVTAGDEWFDDEAADDYVYNEHGTTNGLVRI